MADQKIALITGANKGIGFAAAEALADQGYHVWLGARSAERGQQAEAQLRQKGLDVTFVQLDVTDDSSVRAAADRIGADADHLDVLVNNAGMSNEGNSPDEMIPPSQVPAEKLHELYATNFFGPVSMIQMMLPLLKKSPAGRVVNVSSALGSLTLNSDDNWDGKPFNLLGYKSSKAALNGATLQFAYELRDTPIKVNSANPGLIATDLGGTKAEDRAGQPGFDTPQAGARIIVKLATLPADGPTGGFFDYEKGTIPW